MTTFSPVNLELTEFVGTTGTTVTVIPTTAIPPAIQDALTITNVVISGPKVPSDISITWVGDTFTFSSKFNDFFARTIKYMTYDKATNVKKYFSVNSFNKISPNQYGVYQYIPPPLDYMDIDFTVTLSGTESGTTTAVWTLTLRHDYEASNAAFSAAIAKGSGAVQAIKIYPELK